MLSLCIDEGNTALKFGLFDQKQLIKSDVGIKALSLIDIKQIQNCILSTVLDSSHAKTFLDQQKVNFHLLSPTLKLPFSLLYTTPKTLGVDRIAAIAAAVETFPNQNSLVIVAGTCITYNFINKENDFLGGGISPGVHLRLKAMHQFTAKLPMISLEKLTETALIGNSTESAMLSGAINGTVAEIVQTITSYNERFDNLNILATGGNASFLVSQFKNNIFADPWLQLKGLNYILQLNADEL